MKENYRLLAEVIAAHPSGEVIGRTRLQKTIKLLQRKGLPTNYSFSIFFYGPYSEEIVFDIGLLEHFGIVEEKLEHGTHGRDYYRIKTKIHVDCPEIEPLKPFLSKLTATDPIPLELAATYDAFREEGADHNSSMERLKAKRENKCTESNLDAAFGLLRDLGLQTS